MTRGLEYTVPIAFVCAKCDMCMSTARNLTRHLANQHRICIPKSKEFSSENEVITDNYKETQCILPCITCGITSDTLGELKNHCKDTCFKHVTSPERESNETNQARDYIHWTTEQVTMYFTTVPTNQEYTTEDADAYFTPSPLKASLELQKKFGKVKALNQNLPMQKKPTIQLDHSESSLLPLSLKKALNVKDSDEYSLLLEDIDVSAMYSSAIGDEGLYNIVHRYALKLNECILNNEDLLVCVFAWDVYIVEKIAGDSCAHQRSDDWMETDRAQVSFVRKQEYQGSAYYNNLEIRWGPLTFVAVGILYFNKQDLDFKMKASLGSSVPKDILPTWNKHFDIYTRNEVSPVSDGFRHLRDFGKPSAAFKWSFMSNTLIKKGIYPLHSSQLWKIIGDNERTPKFSTIVSLIIECYLTDQCSQRQAGVINTALYAKKISLGPTVKSVLKSIAAKTEGGASIKQIVLSKLNLLNQYKDAKLYEAVANENSDTIKKFLNKQ